MFWIFFILMIQTIRISVPYNLAALGGVFSERGGVVNIALEGILLIGAFFYVIGTWYSMKYLPPEHVKYLAPCLGVLCGVLASALTGIVISFVCVTLKADQILTGLAINLFAVGFTKFANEVIFLSPSNSEWVLGFPSLQVFSSAPQNAINTLFNPLIIIAFILVLLSLPLLFKTRFGLRLRAVGENPAAADFAGVSVWFYRYSGVILGSAVCGLGGVWLAADQCRFSAHMSSGRGYIALAAMIVGKWHPLWAFCACLVFGFIESLQVFLQSKGFAIIPNQFIQMLPYVLTIIVLAGWIGKSVAPAADGIPYEKEKQNY